MSWLSSAFKSITGTSISSLAAPLAAAAAPFTGGASLAAVPFASTIAALVSGESGGAPTPAPAPVPTSASDIIGNIGKVLLGQNTNIPGTSIPVAGASIGAVSAGATGGGAFVRAISLGAAALAGTVGLVRSVGGRILGWILPSGAKVSSEAAVKLAKEIGLTAAATALGASVVDLAEAVMHHDKKKKHHRRGITAAQLRTTGRTIRRVERMHHTIARLASSAVHHRRAAPRVTVIERKR